MYGPQQEYYAYFDPRNAATISKAVKDLQEYVDADGPFDGIIGYSQGAALAATLLLQDQVDRPSQLQPRFKCAIFFAGGIPFSPVALRVGRVEYLDPAVDGQPIRIPTASIWGSNDVDFPGTSRKLSQLCQTHCRAEVIHNGGHVIPTLKGDLLADVVDAFQRTVEKALLDQ